MERKMDSSQNLNGSQTNQYRNSLQGSGIETSQVAQQNTNGINDFKLNTEAQSQSIRGSTLALSGINSIFDQQPGKTLGQSISRSLMTSNFGEMMKSRQTLAFDFTPSIKFDLSEILEGNYNLFNGKLYKEIEKEYSKLDIKFNSCKGIFDESNGVKLEGVLNISNNEIFFLETLNKESFSKSTQGKEILEWIEKKVIENIKKAEKSKKNSEGKISINFIDKNEKRHNILRCINLLENGEGVNKEFLKLFQDALLTMQYMENKESKENLKDAEKYRKFFINQIFNKIYQKEFSLYDKNSINLKNLYFFNGDIERVFKFEKSLNNYDVFSIFTLTRIVEKCFNVLRIRNDFVGENYHKMTNVDTFVLLKPRRFLNFISKICQIPTDNKLISKDIEDDWNEIFIEKAKSKDKFNKKESFEEDFKNTNSIFLYAHNQLIENIAHQLNKLYSFLKIESKSFENDSFLKNFENCLMEEVEKNKSMIKSQSMSNSQTYQQNNSTILKSSNGESVVEKSLRPPIFMDFMNKINKIFSLNSKGESTNSKGESKVFFSSSSSLNRDKQFEEFQTLMTTIDRRIQDLYLNMLRFNLFMKNIYGIDCDNKDFLINELNNTLKFSANIAKSKIQNPESPLFEKTIKIIIKIINQFQLKSSEVNFFGTEFRNLHYKGMEMILETIGLKTFENNKDIKVKAIWPEMKKETSAPMQSLYITNLLQKEEKTKENEEKVKEKTKENYKLAYQKFFATLFGSINKHNPIFANEMLCSPCYRLEIKEKNNIFYSILNFSSKFLPLENSYILNYISNSDYKILNNMILNNIQVYVDLNTTKDNDINIIKIKKIKQVDKQVDSEEIIEKKKLKLLETIKLNESEYKEEFKKKIERLKHSDFLDFKKEAKLDLSNFQEKVKLISDYYLYEMLLPLEKEYKKNTGRKDQTIKTIFNSAKTGEMPRVLIDVFGEARWNKIIEKVKNYQIMKDNLLSANNNSDLISVFKFITLLPEILIQDVREYFNEKFNSKKNQNLEADQIITLLINNIFERDFHNPVFCLDITGNSYTLLDIYDIAYHYFANRKNISSLFFSFIYSKESGGDLKLMVSNNSINKFISNNTIEKKDFSRFTIDKIEEDVDNHEKKITLKNKKNKSIVDKSVKEYTVFYKSHGEVSSINQTNVFNREHESILLKSFEINDHLKVNTQIIELSEN